MTLHSVEFENLIKQYRHERCLFSEISNSTSSVEGKLSGVEFNESELIKFLECDEKIVAIDCNFGHEKYKNYKEPEVPKKSNRGRKKKAKVPKNRKYQGDGSSFNSQINFTVLGKNIRKKPEKPDIYSAKARKINDTTEEIIKEYKIKIFRNGKFTVPGVLNEDLSDLLESLRYLCDYLEIVLWTKISILEIGTTMRNYKFKLLQNFIDLTKFCDTCSKKLKELISVDIDSLHLFLKKPKLLLDGKELSVEECGWKKVAYIIADKKFTVNYNTLTEIVNGGDIFIEEDYLMDIIQEYSLQEEYQKYVAIVACLGSGEYRFSQTLLDTILDFMVREKTTTIDTKLTQNLNNLISRVKYDPEKFPGLLLYMKTPIQNTKKKNYDKKKTTVKIFKQKINIDGANNRYEAECIYWWLNHLMIENKKLIYNPDEVQKKDSDDEDFSESE
jgi:hypothetical protein